MKANVTSTVSSVKANAAVTTTGSARQRAAAAQLPPARRWRLLALPLIFPLVLTACSGEPAGGPPASAGADTAQDAAAPSIDDTQTPADAADGAAEQDGAGDSATRNKNQGNAFWTMAGESFSWILELCLVSDTDVVAYGPGRGNESAEPAYLDVDLTNGPDDWVGGARIDLGTLERFNSSESFYAFDTAYFAGDFSITTSTNRLDLDGNLRFQGENDLGPGKLTLICTPEG